MDGIKRPHVLITASVVFIASPFSGDVERNTVYARAALLDSLMRGEAPYVPHLLYPQVLDDRAAAQRERGCAAALTVLEHGCSVLAVYDDFGISTGMQAEIDLALRLGIRCVYRSIQPGGS